MWLRIAPHISQQSVAYTESFLKSGTIVRGTEREPCLVQGGGYSQLSRDLELRWHRLLISPF
jgi:hypothetical protein